MRVGVLGGGRWGQALARLILAAGNEPYIAYEGRRPPQILRSTDQPELVPAACDLVFVATSAAETRGALKVARPGPGNRLVLAGRGIEPETGRWLSQVVAETTDVVRVGALAGPAPVDEILNGGLCAGVIASPYAEVRSLAVSALHSSRYRAYESADLTGVELAGALVPTLAALIGVASTLQGAGVGMQAMVLARGLEEAGRLARATGADPLTFSGLAGVGDLVAVQGRAGHPAFEAGAALARGTKPEGGPAGLARALLAVARRHRVDMPLTESLVAMVDGEAPLEVLRRLMGRRATAEHR